MEGIILTLALLTVPQAMVAGIVTTIGSDYGRHGVFFGLLVAGLAAVLAVMFFLPVQSGEDQVGLGSRLLVAAAWIVPYFSVALAIVGNVDADGAERAALVRGCGVAMLGGAPLTMFAVSNIGCRFYSCL
jgi:hypothetical protein